MYHREGSNPGVSRNELGALPIQLLIDQYSMQTRTILYLKQIFHWWLITESLVATVDQLVANHWWLINGADHAGAKSVL